MSKELTIINQEGKLLADSREVAEMVGKEHSKLLRDIRNYCNVMNESKIGLVNFFIESSYQDLKGEKRPCYLLTKQGCEMVANKMTGEKGILFTAEYVLAFNKMEETIKNPIGLLESMQNKLKEQEERISKLESTNELIKKALNTGSKKEVKKLLPKNMGDVEKVQLLIFANLDRYTTCIKDGKRIMDRKPINDDCKRLFGLTPCLVKKALDYIEGVESSSKVFSIEDKSFRACVVDL